MVNVRKDIKEAKKSMLKQLLERGEIRPSALQKQMLKLGHKINRKTIKKYIKQSES